MAIRHAILVALFAAGLTTAGAAPSAADQKAPERTIVMTGEGKVKAMPDTAIVSGGVVTQSRRPADALRDNTEAMAKAIAALKAMGFSDKDIATSSVRFQPQYETDHYGNTDPKRRIIGYTVTNRVSVTLTEKIERAGEVFDALIQNGANDFAAVTFQIRDIESLENQARAEAARNAAAHALVYAKALGVELGPVKFVREGSGTQIVDQIIAEDIGRLPDKNVAEALQRLPGISLVPSRIEASEQTITRVVTVTWILK